MGQAKNRGTYEDRVKKAEAKFKPSNISGFIPDAGLNSKQSEDNYYWFQQMEFLPSLATINNHLKCTKDKNEVLLKFSVDIMDKQGKDLVISRDDAPKGLMLSAIFSLDVLEKLGEQIRKGGMAVRLTGRPVAYMCKVEKPGVMADGELYKDVRITDVYSEGNISGIQHIFTPLQTNNYINSDMGSNEIARTVKFFREKTKETA